jgi:hypothetical protein
LKIDAGKGYEIPINQLIVVSIDSSGLAGLSENRIRNGRFETFADVKKRNCRTISGHQIKQ